MAKTSDENAKQKHQCKRALTNGRLRNLTIVYLLDWKTTYIPWSSKTKRSSAASGKMLSRQGLSRLTNGGKMFLGSFRSFPVLIFWFSRFLFVFGFSVTRLGDF